ncbi:hypothetical protein ACFLXQ_07925 [Chloroflexota bacterium]
MKTCGGSYVYPYCFEEAADYVAYKGGSAPSVHGTISTVGNSYTGSIEDNYAINWVSLPTSGGPYDVTLSNTSDDGKLRGSVVCDTGTALNITALPVVVGGGDEMTLTDFYPTGCTSVVAVVTNQKRTGDNPSLCTARSYQLSTPASASGSSLIYLPLILKNS